MEMHLTFQMVQICGAGNTQFCLQGSKQSRKSDIFAMRPKCLPPTLHLYLTTRCTKHFQVCIYHQSPQKHGAPLLLQALLQIRIISAKPHSFSLLSWRAGMNERYQGMRMEGIREMGNHWEEPQCQAAFSSKPTFRVIYGCHWKGPCRGCYWDTTM